MRAIFCTFLVAALAWADAALVERGRNLFARGQYKQAIELLSPQAQSNGAPAHDLIGKSYYMMGEYKNAVEAFERAVNADPNNAVYFNWLGKAYGRRAETSNPLMAPSYASKARQSFEKSVALDGRNIEAINDLFSYYIEAPGFLGGGLDKAATLAKKIQAIDPVEYHYAMAQLDQQRKEFQSAESHLRRAVELAPRQAGRIIDLAKFLSKQGRHQESDVIFAQAEKVAPDAPRLLFERASSYIRAKRNLPQARQLLERYLKSTLTPDDPPRSEAEKLLRQASGA